MSATSKPTVVITGASRGIGAAIVRTLRASGVRVVGVARSKDALQRLSEEKIGGSFEFVSGSVSDQKTRQQVIDLAGPRIDALILNAGTAEPIGKIADVGIDQHKTAFDVNLFSQLDLARLALPKLRAAKGRIVATTSGIVGFPLGGWAAYCSSKAALNMYIQVLALEEPDVTVVAIEPGIVETEMVKEVKEKGKSVFSKEQYAGMQPLWQEGSILKAEQPAEKMAKAALKAPKELSGKVIKWDDPKLASL